MHRSLAWLLNGKILITIVVILSVGSIVGTYQYQKSQKTLSYQKAQTASSSLTFFSEPISEGEWRKLLLNVNGTSASSTEVLTNSDILSREIFARFVAEKQDGNEVTPESAKVIADDILAYANTLDTELVQYSLGDLKVFDDESLNALTIYNARFIAALEIKNSPGNEVTILQEILVDSNMQNIDKFKDISAAYKTVASQLLAVPVPSAIANDHLNLVNFFMRISKNVSTFALMNSDPFIATANFNDYSAATLTYDTSLNNIRAFLVGKGVTF